METSEEMSKLMLLQNVGELIILRRIVALLLFCFSNLVFAQDATPANFLTKNSYISFWQKDVVLVGQGMCVVELAFDGNDLITPIEKLTISVRIVSKDGEDFGVGKINLNKVGGSKAENYQTTSFDGREMTKWDEAMLSAGASPLCWEGTTLVIESATGEQSGKAVDLLKHKQIRYTTRQLLNVEVK